ncbi:MAG TPA: SAM-dependent methyltransferase [Streptosporangiaceae bacterium]|nr:SAM-dependent methyltransferase [Streptosporangiaceae bacterium]
MDDSDNDDDLGLLAPYNPGPPHPARIYSYWLGGKDHSQADRDAAEEVICQRPQVVRGARANRAFLRRITWYAARDCGIGQFLDIGTGLPAPGATHEIAQQVIQGCRVAYADNDPLVLAHARALLTPSSSDAGTCDYIDADVRDPGKLLASAAAVLDFTQPVAVWLLAILHFLADTDDPAGIVAELAGALAPGSLIAISHLTADYAPGPVTAGTAAYNARVPAPVYPRSHSQVAALFGDLGLQWPEIVPVTRWRPSPQQSPGGPCDIYGGLAVIMRPPGQPHPAHRPATAQPGHDPDTDRLAQLVAEYPGYDIWRETILDRTRYVARSTSLATRPHTVITASLIEIRAELTAAQPCRPGTVLPPGPGDSVPVHGPAP